ncbi:hypothetical protein WISP_56501 [Willisornis vidua]|uniref:Reverse transcriptase domain-containing protein n=1 Tax=Willisornis vidua TaxID=1566151 RepID=A0ABQ9DC77_9PASS|nr:hypothetical protein WISP_56501 [Willisornis vidua]
MINSQSTLKLWDLLLQLDPHKSMGPDEMHPSILKELADVITKPLSMIFEQPWESREVPADWKLVNVVLIFKEDLRNNEPVHLSSVPDKVMKIMPGCIEKHLKDNTVTGPTQHGFMMGKSCLSHLTFFYDKVQDLALGLVELHEVCMGPPPKPVKVPLDGIPSLHCVNCTTQFGVIGKPAEGALHPATNVANKDLKQCQSQNWPLRKITYHCSPLGLQLAECNHLANSSSTK